MTSCVGYMNHYGAQQIFLNDNIVLHYVFTDTFFEDVSSHPSEFQNLRKRNLRYNTAIKVGLPLSTKIVLFNSVRAL